MDAIWMESPGPSEPASLAERLAAAELYLAQGWALVPLRSGTKKPNGGLLPKDASGRPRWKPLSLEPATWAQVQAWFAVDPECDLGILTGRASGGLLVADFDRRPPILPPTPIARSWRGCHAYLTATGDTRARTLAWGELKGDGGYAVAPPSWHPEGVRYAWAPLFSPTEVELFPLPALLVEGYPRKFKPQQSKGMSAGVARNNVPCYRGPGEGEKRPAGEVLDGRLGELVGLECVPEVVIAVLRSRGCTVERVGQSFLCPLPGHEETRPSAGLWHTEGRPLLLKCFHDDAVVPMADLCAALITGKLRKLGKGERAIWWIRALHEAELVKAPLVPARPLPEHAPKSVRKLYEGFCYLLSLRKLYAADQEGTPFTWAFAAHWCGIGSMTTVGEANKWLLASGHLRVVQEGRAGGEGSRSAALLALGVPAER